NSRILYTSNLIVVTESMIKIPDNWLCLFGFSSYRYSNNRCVYAIFIQTRKNTRLSGTGAGGVKNMARPPIMLFAINSQIFYRINIGFTTFECVSATPKIVRIESLCAEFVHSK